MNLKRKTNQRGWSLIEFMAAAIIVGIGVGLFLKTQKMSNRHSSGNTKMLKAGQMIENHLDSLRGYIARNPTSNFPGNQALTTVVASAAPDFIKLTRLLENAPSPKDGITVTDVRKVTLTASWGTGPLDTLRVVTFVARRF